MPGIGRLEHSERLTKETKNGVIVWTLPPLNGFSLIIYTAFKAIWISYRLSHNLLNFWNKLQAGFSTSGLDNYAALCKIQNDFKFILPPKANTTNLTQFNTLYSLA